MVLKIFTFIYSLSVAALLCAMNIVSVSAMEEVLYPTPHKDTPPTTPEKQTLPKARILQNIGDVTPPASPQKLDSQNCSPCEQTPQKRANPSDRKSRVLRGLDFGNTGNSFYEDSPVAKDHFEAALHQVRRCDAPAGENAPPRYLCALLSPESEGIVEKALVGFLKQKTRSRTIERILDTRNPHTVIDFSSRDAHEKRFHMSLTLPDVIPSDEELGQLIKILLKVEFAFSHLECMGRFMAIMLSKPNPIDESISADDLEFLGRYLQHDKGKPVMHISLMMINSSREEMECIPPQSPFIEVPVPDKDFDLAIKSAEATRDSFNPRDFKQTLSGLYLNYLKISCAETRDYIANVPSEKKKNLYPFLCDQANIVLHAIPSLTDITRVYFRKAFDADFDFTDKLHLEYNGFKADSLDAQVTNSLLAKILLSSDKPDFKSFTEFRKFAGFFIDETRRRIAEREHEIICGRTIVDAYFDLFETEPQELTEEEKQGHREQNDSDRLRLKIVEEELSRLFVMRYLFGIPLNEMAFDEFISQDVEVSKLLLNLTQTNLFHPDFIIDDAEPFQNFLDTFVHFKVGVEREIRETISQSKDKKIEVWKRDKGNCCKEVHFLHSQIQNPMFWHKFWHSIENNLFEALLGVKFNFSGLSFQARLEE